MKPRHAIRCRFLDDAVDEEIGGVKDHARWKRADQGTAWFRLPPKGALAAPLQRQTLVIELGRPRRVNELAIDYFTFRMPAFQVPDLSVQTLACWHPRRRRWERLSTVPALDASRQSVYAPLIGCGLVTVTFRFEAVATSAFRLAIGHGPRGCALHAARARLAPARRLPSPAATDTTPDSEQRGRRLVPACPLGGQLSARREAEDFIRTAFPRLTQDMAAHTEEARGEFLKRRVRPFHGRALLGLKDDHRETGVDWDNTVIEERAGGSKGPFVLTGFAGEPPVALGDGAVRQVRRGLIEGYLPGTDMAYDDGTLRYEARTFVARTGGAPERSATFWTVDIVNRRNRAATATLRAVFMGLQSLAYQVVQPVDLHCRRAEGGRLILTGRKVCLVAPAGGAFAAGIENVLRYRLSLTAGGRARLTFVIPRFDCSPADGRGLARVDPDAAFREMRREWRAILARGSRVRLPDARFNRLYRSLVIHGFINAEGDRMPYGAFPSQYNHTVFGVEEGWLMTALASFGFGADALRYCAGTYLTPGHFDRKAYGHPYRIGLALTYACELFRLTGDREWFKKQAAVLNSGADWIAAARRRTMRARAGRKPVHWGLLPKEFYGGDIHKRAYSLYPNAVCWRALRDLGLALQAAGESGASRWLEEAGAYRRRIRAAMRATQNRTVDPPFLSLKLYWRKPFPFSPTHYQLFLPMFMESWIVDLGGREAGCLADWLDANGKFFSGIPMLYPMRLDPVYGLGYAYAKLFSGRIDEYLSGVYTYLNAVMDRRFFTQPETGDLSLRPEDWAWEVRSESKSPAIWLHQSNPLPAAGAVVLLMLRHMLVAETRDAAGAADGGLLLAPALPRSWLAPGRRVAAQDLATHFGPVSYAVSVARDGRTIECRLDRAPGAGCRRIGWRLRLPRSASLAGARVSSARPADLDTTREGLWMPNPGKPARWVIGLRGGV